MSSFAKTFAVVKPFILPALAFAALVAALAIGIQAIGLENIRQAILDAGPLAPILFILLRALTYVAAPLTTGPIVFSAGILFGFVPGVIYSLAGEVLGGSLNFWIARILGRAIVRRFVGAEGMERVDRFTNQIANWQMLAYARLFLFSIWDFLSYTAGLTSLTFRTYLIVSVVVGAIPTVIAVALGTTLTEERSDLWILYGLVAVATVVPLVFHKQIRRWLKVESTP